MKGQTDLSESIIFPLGEKNDAYAQYFIGQSYLNMLSTAGVGIANVTFEPGCRNNWHIHHKGGQILLVTGGRGYYQEWGKAAQELQPGDVVNIPPEVKHWHGAAKDSWFVHLAVEVPSEGGSNEWLEPVDDEQYGKLRSGCQKKVQSELRSIQLIDSLAKNDMGVSELKQLKELMDQEAWTKEEQLRLLKKCRFRLLDDIHGKQQMLDRMDYIIYTIKHN